MEMVSPCEKFPSPRTAPPLEELSTRKYSLGEKTALIIRFSVIETVVLWALRFARPSPDHPTKMKPSSGVAVIEGVVPSEKLPSPETDPPFPENNLREY
jgi:hypothetical protein